MRPTAAFRSALLVAAGLLAGCDMLGIESAEKIAAAREADGKAIGGACRHAGRAIEDCYAIYKKADRAAVFAGWRDMNDYMRENKIEPVAPQLAAQAQGSASRAALAAGARDASPPPRSESTASPLHLELADHDALAALALDPDRRPLVLLRRRWRSRSTATASGRCSVVSTCWRWPKKLASTRYLPGLATLSANSSGP